MRYPTQLLQSVAILATFGVLSFASGAQAQTTSTDPTQSPRVNTSEGFGSADTSANSLGGGINAFDLIHRATLMNGTTMEDYSRQQRGYLDNEAANFRMRQQEALQQQAQPQPLEDSGEVE